MHYSNRIIEEIIKILQENLLEELKPEKEYTPIYANDIKVSHDRNN